MNIHVNEEPTQADYLTAHNEALENRIAAALKILERDTSEFGVPRLLATIGGRLMTPCVIESPYAGNIDGNTAYLQDCIRWCVAHGYTPYASHQMLTSALHDNDDAQRQQGIAAGIAMAHALAGIGAPWFFFADLGWSMGMRAALSVATDPRVVYLRNGQTAAVSGASAYFVDGHWYGPAPRGWAL